MIAVSAAQISEGLVNASSDLIQTMRFPDLENQAWEQLDFLGWQDPTSPNHGYLIVEFDDRLLGFLVYIPLDDRQHQRRSMCDLCHSVLPGGGARLLSIPKAGQAGLILNMIGA